MRRLCADVIQQGPRGSEPQGDRPPLQGHAGGDAGQSLRLRGVLPQGPHQRHGGLQLACCTLLRYCIPLLQPCQALSMHVHACPGTVPLDGFSCVTCVLILRRFSHLCACCDEQHRSVAGISLCLLGCTAFTASVSTGFACGLTGLRASTSCPLHCQQFLHRAMCADAASCTAAQADCRYNMCQHAPTGEEESEVVPTSDCGQMSLLRCAFRAADRRERAQLRRMHAQKGAPQRPAPQRASMDL